MAVMKSEASNGLIGGIDKMKAKKRCCTYYADYKGDQVITFAMAGIGHKASNGLSSDIGKVEKKGLHLPRTSAIEVIK